MNTESKKVLVGEGVKFERIRRITGYLGVPWIVSTTPNAPKLKTA